MEKESFCLSGKPKPFSHKHQATNNEKKGRDLFSKFRSAPPIRQETAAGLKERPRTAVKKVSNKNLGQQSSSSRPSSATLNKNSYKTRFRFPSLKSTQSIDSAVGSQQSSTDEDNKSSDDNEEEDSHDQLTSDEDVEESSEDSGIMKVRIVSRSTEDTTSASCSSAGSPTGSPTARAILVQEFNRTPDINNDEGEDHENLECEESIDSEDEESKAEILHTPKFTLIKSEETDPEEEPVINKDVVLMEVGPEDSSEIITCCHLNDLHKTEPDVTCIKEHELTIDDIEYDININKEVAISPNNFNGSGIDERTSGEHHEEKSFRPSLEHDVIENKKEYDPNLYNNGRDSTTTNSSLVALMNHRDDTVDKATIDIKDSYQDLIKSTIMKLENEEFSFSTNKKEEKTNSTETIEKLQAKEAKDEKVPELDDHLTSEELENLKKKCLSRMKDHQSTPIVVNPPVLSDFSNSQKLLNFLDEAEEKDKTILNSVKRSSYNIQVRHKTL